MKLWANNGRLPHVPRAALAGGVETLEGEELPSLVEALGSLRDPEQASSAAAQISVRRCHLPEQLLILW